MFEKNLADTSVNLVNQTAHAADRAISATQHMASDARDRLLDTSHQLRLKAEHASESTVNYIRHEPIKSILIAAATGAALMALISLISGNRNRH